MFTIAGQKVRALGAVGAAKAFYWETAKDWKIARGIAQTAKALFPSLDPHSYLKQVSGVIHIGANLGQERQLYANYNLKVLWIEPLPEVFERLCENIAQFSRQTAANHLVTDKDDEEYLFHVANNDGQSSSIMDLARHREIWPDIDYVSELKLKSITLDSLLKDIADTNSYQGLIMDTQGSELLVLKGATRLKASVNSNSSGPRPPILKRMRVAREQKS